MVDVGLRELERRFRASGSVEDEAAWLRARVQVGDLERGRLELAALLGHACSRRHLGLPAWSARETLPALFKLEPSAAPAGLFPRVVATCFRRLALVWREQAGSTSWNGWRGDLDHLDLADRLDALEAALLAEDAGGIEQGLNLLMASMPWLAEQIYGPLHNRLVLMALADSTARGETVWENTVLAEALSAELVPWLLDYADPVRLRATERGEAEIRAGDLGVSAPGGRPPRGEW